MNRIEDGTIRKFLAAAAMAFALAAEAGPTGGDTSEREHRSADRGTSTEIARGVLPEASAARKGK